MNDKVRNILFITSDQQRRDTLPCYGTEFMKTPNLDRLAAQGVVFDNCTSASPLCQPVRASFMLGQYPFVTGVTDNFRWISPNAPTIARRFAEAGWNTAAIGKMHFYPWDNPEGFQYRICAEDKRHVFRVDDWTKSLHRHGYLRDHPAVVEGYARDLGAIVSPLPEEHHIDSFIGSEAVRWIETDARDRFFAWVSFNSPHDPYDPPASYASLYRDAPIPEPVGDTSELSNKPSYQTATVDFYNQNPLFLTDYRHMSPKQIRRMREYYYATVSLVDHQVGRILEALERRGLLDSTLIIFSSDHGDNLGDHGLPFKSNFYEGSLMVPLIVAGPGIPAGMRNESFVDWVDLHAALLSVAGIPSGDHAQGEDISPLFWNPNETMDRAGFSELIGCAMVRDKRYKLVACDDGDGELYDLREAPLEVINHFTDPAFAEVRARLSGLLLQHLVANSRVRSFGGGKHPSDPERETAFREIKEKVKRGEFAGLE